MTNKQNQGCGCLRIPLSVILAIVGSSYWWLIHQGNINKFSQFIPNLPLANLPVMGKPPSLHTPISAIAPMPVQPSKVVTVAPTDRSISIKNNPQTLPQSVQKSPTQTLWDKKAIRGIYLSRYQVTNNASEQTIRQRVRYYHDRGFNTIVHGVWGNGCTMYNSEVMQQMLGAKSCHNLFQDRWLEWTIEEAHKQGMQVHAYFEKGIKIDKNSPIFDRAIANKWIVPGVDRTYAQVEHYVLDVEIPEVANLFQKMLAEFVTKYPKIDAVQWDDYLGYHAELPGKVDRTASLTKFVREMMSQMTAANPNVSFDLCHHNPYWAKRYFAADWEQWKVNSANKSSIAPNQVEMHRRIFIQDYNEKNFKEELNYAINYAGVAITDNQLHRLKELVDNPKINGILIFPLAGKPEDTADRVHKMIIANENNKI
jgi:uncharacterized lipoprotein YddW (UPF0748 family)